MIDIKVNITEDRSGFDVLAKNLQKLKGKAVDVGIQSSEDSELLQYANIHEFGGTIDHPGGTSYGYKTQKDAEEGNVRFLKKGQGFMELGVTEPHEIDIPARPFIRQTFAKRQDELSTVGFDLGKLVINGQLSVKQALEIWGDKAVSFIRSEIAEGNNFVPNKAATIKRKGAGLHPLQDSGRLQQALKAVIVNL